MACKILFIHHGGGIGGAPVSMLQLAAGLDRTRYTPLAVFTQPGPILDFARDLGVPASVVPLRSAFAYGAHVPLRLRTLVPFLTQYWTTVRRAQALIRSERPDLVHLNTVVLLPTAVGVKRESVPLVWHVREVPGPHPLLRRWQTRAILRLADRVVANSEAVRAAFPEPDRVTVVHNAVDLAHFDLKALRAREQVRAAFGIPTNAPVVGMIGSVQVVKGHFLLVEAARRIVEQVPNAHFLIVAGGVGPEYVHSWKGRVKRMLGRPLDERERMEWRVRDAGLADRFHFTGFRSDIPQMLAATDVLAFLSQAPEGFGRPLIEAMAMARPVVATDVGPSREILGEGTGVLVPPGDQTALADALVTLLTDTRLRESLGRAGRCRVETMFTLRQHVKRMQRVYQDLLEARNF